MSFSQRIGKKPIRVALQLESMDADLRASLWNCFHLCFLDKFTGPTDTEYLLTILDTPVSTRHPNLGSFEGFFRTIWTDFLKSPLSSLANDFGAVTQNLQRWFFEAEWHEVYDFIEFIAQVESPTKNPKFVEACNTVLERELSGYRFVGTQLTPITDSVELSEIEEAIQVSEQAKLSAVKIHLESALSKLSDRKNPDYRNSIKESISAVEAISQIIASDPKATLGQALKVIEDEVGLHPALKKGFLAIYGYTSDADGIRHALTDVPKCDFGDAKYMLVSCSAFINYLIMKAHHSLKIHQ